jgi:hypothetical protein
MPLKLKRAADAAPCLIPAIGRGDPARPIRPGEVVEIPDRLAWSFLRAEEPDHGWEFVPEDVQIAVTPVIELPAVPVADEE